MEIKDINEHINRINIKILKYQIWDGGDKHFGGLQHMYSFFKVNNVNPTDMLYEAHNFYSLIQCKKLIILKYMVM